MSNKKEKINSSGEKRFMKTPKQRSLRKKNNLGDNEEGKQQTGEGSPKKMQYSCWVTTTALIIALALERN